MIKNIRYILTQVAIATCVFISCQGQYMNELIVTPDKNEYPHSFLWNDGNLIYSFGQQDTLWDNYGYGSFHWKEVDENLIPLQETYHIDTGYLYLGNSMIEKDGFYYSGGFKDSAYYNSDTTQSFLIKMDANGSVVWEKRFYDTNEISRVVDVLSHDTIIVIAGHCYNPTSGVSPNLSFSFVMALDTNGTELWSKTIPNLNLQTLSFTSTQDGGFLLSTYSQLSGSLDQTRVYKLDNLGNTQWSRTVGDGINRRVYLSATEMPSGEILCYGSSTEIANSDAHLVKLSSGGLIIKDTIYNLSPSKDGFGAVSVLFKNNKIYLSGGWYVPYYSSFLCEINSDLEMQWINNHEKRQYQDIFYHLSAYPPNPDYIFMAGLSYPTPGVPTESVDAWFVVVDSLGCEVANCTSGILEIEKESRLMNLYPNPSNGFVHVELSQLTVAGQLMEIQITDIQGKLITQLPLGNLSAYYEFTTEDQGLYLVHLLKDGERVETQKLVLTK